MTTAYLGSNLPEANPIQIIDEAALKRIAKKLDLKHSLDLRPVRHTIGRIDSVFRVAVMPLVALFQLGKIVLKTAVCILTLGQLFRCEETKTWSLQALANDVAFLLTLGYKTAIAARDILVAPKKGYASAVSSLGVGLENVFEGKYHDRINQSSLGTFIREDTTDVDPFFAITDKQQSRTQGQRLLNKRTKQQREFTTTTPNTAGQQLYSVIAGNPTLMMGYDTTTQKPTE